MNFMQKYTTDVSGTLILDVRLIPLDIITTMDDELLRMFITNELLDREPNYDCTSTYMWVKYLPPILEQLSWIITTYHDMLSLADGNWTHVGLSLDEEMVDGYVYIREHIDTLTITQQSANSFYITIKKEHVCK